jgi:hypothetical protein
MDDARLNESQKKEWDSVIKSLDNGNDFEKAMNNVKDEELISKIVKYSGDFISKNDFEYSQKILTGEIEWPASNLFKKLVKGLPGTDRELHVATSNYDMLAETSFDKNGIPYVNGFCGGLNRRLNWEQSKRSITYVDKVPYGKKVKPVTRKKRHIAFYKVHGSLNLFLFNEELIENNAWIYSAKPDNAERLIITPGTSKFEKLHMYRQELLGKYDEAIEKHDFFLFLGFGFNDSQLNTKAISDKLKKCNGLIITKNSNERINEIMEKSQNLWLICEAENRQGAIIKNNKFASELFVDEELWKVDVFTKTILGD